MNNPLDESQGEGVPAGNNRLDSWKEIAAYLNRGVTTVQRWEQEEGLPVHRLPHAKKGSVYAFGAELDAWRTARSRLASEAAAPAPSTAPAVSPESAPLTLGARRLRIAVPLAAILAALVVGGVSVTWFGRRAAFARAGDATALSVQPRSLANEATTERHPSLSPDGQHVVYSWRAQGRGTLFIKAVAGGAPRSVPLGLEIPASFPAWSPRGDLIAFLSRETESTRGLYVVPSTGGTARKLTVIAGIGICWAPSGNAIGFADRNSDSEPFSIFAIDLRSGSRQRLTTPSRGTFGDTECAFSPEGQRLALARFATRSQSDVHVVDVPETERRPATPRTRDFSGIVGIAWTPDGRDIVVGSHAGLWRVSQASDTLQPPALIAGGANDLTMPSFSSARSGGNVRLVYERAVRDVNVWKWSSGAERPTLLTPGVSYDDYPSVSPDGARIAFSSNRSGHTELWTAKTDGSDSKQLTFHAGPLVITPKWSPDGEWLAFSSQVAGNRDIYVIRADGSQSRRLTYEPSQEENPSWSRDGTSIYFKSDRTGIGQLWKIATAGGAASLVTKGEASQGFESPDGAVLYFVRSSNTPGLWSMPVDGGAETFVVGDVREGLWDVTDRGCMFVARLTQAPSGAPAVIQLFDFSSRTLSTITPIARWPDAERGFAASRDGRTVVWTQAEESQSDVMVIDQWR